MPQIGDELLTLAEAADLLGYHNKCPAASVANLCRRGTLPFVVDALHTRTGKGGTLRVWRADVLALRPSIQARTAERLQRERARLDRLSDPAA